MDTNNLLTILMMNGLNNKNSTMNGNNDSMTVIYSFILMTLSGYVMKVLPQIGEFLKNNIEKLIENFIRSKKDEFLKKDESSSVELEFTNELISNKCSAVLHYIALQNETKSLKFKGNYYTVNNPLTFNLGHEDFTCRYMENEIKIEERQTQKTIIRTVLTITTKKFSLLDIREWIYKIEKDYDSLKNNKLGDDKYFFNEHSIKNENLTFSMFKFSTNKTLNNIFGPEINEVNRLVNLFSNNPSWYSERGLPHTLGLMLSGPPGTGKTSTIKAIAKVTNRHIISLSLKNTTTQQQLLNIFYSDTLYISGIGEYSNVLIPQNKRLYVFEDVDCLSDIVLARKENNEDENEKLKKENEKLKEMIDRLKNGDKKEKEKDIKEEEKLINLSFLLNLFDGIIEIPNRLLIMTSNHPEKIDPAILRPGRIDLNVRYKNCDNETLLKMFQHFFNETELRSFDKNYSHLISPARTTQIFSTYYNNKEEAFKELLKILEEELNKTQEVQEKVQESQEKEFQEKEVQKEIQEEQEEKEKKE